MDGDLLRLKATRILRGYTQTSLAKATGLAQSTIANIEKGRKKPNSKTLRLLAEALRVSADEILDWTLKGE